MLLIVRGEYFLHDCLKIEIVCITTACHSWNMALFCL